MIGLCRKELPSSPAIALRLVTDVDVQNRRINIDKSRHLGADSDIKTEHSRRNIKVPSFVIDALQTLPAFHFSGTRLFTGKTGQPLNANQWAKDYWKRILESLGIRPRKFYATRHTHITEMVKRGEVLKAIADNCGTSVDMIEKNYCGTTELSDEAMDRPNPMEVFGSRGVGKSHQPKIDPGLSKWAVSGVVPTGIEPVFPT